MTKSLCGCSEQQLDEFNIIDQVCLANNLPKEQLVWDNGCYRLPDYDKPNFTLFSNVLNLYNHVYLQYNLGQIKENQSLSSYLKNRKTRLCGKFLDKYLVTEVNRQDIINVGHLIACSLVPYAEGAADYFNKKLPVEIKRSHQYSNIVPETAWCNTNNKDSSRGQAFFERIVRDFIKQHDDFESIEYKVTPLYLDADPDKNLPIMIAMQAKIHANDTSLRFPVIDSNSFSVLIPNTQVGIPELDYGFAKLKFE